MWSCTRARWAMRISDELNRFEKGLRRVAEPFFCVKGKAFSAAGVRIATPVTEVERICVSFRDQSADWSWESVIPLYQGRGERIATTSESVTGFAMTSLTRSAVCGGTHGSRPTERFVGADDPVRPASITQHLVGQGPCALPGAEKNCRADVGIGPYESATRGAMGGRPQGSPLRKRYKGRRKRIPQSRLRRASPL